jgi:hypothetical protein
VDQMFAAVAYTGRHRVGRGVGRGVDRVFYHHTKKRPEICTSLVKSSQVMT